MKVKLGLIFLLLIKCLCLWAQPYHFKHYQVEAGLSYNSVMCSLQDRNGFMWFGTKNGLNRFDGYRFKIFQHDPDQSGSLGHNFIYSLLEDRNGLLWVGTLKGLYRYDPTTEIFRLVEGTRDRVIYNLSIDSKGKVWFTAGNQLQRFDPHTGQLKSFDIDFHGVITSISIAVDDEVWVATSLGFLRRYQPTTGSFESYSVFDRSARPLTRWIEKIKATQDGFLLVGTSSQGIKVFDTHQHTYRDLQMGGVDQTVLFVRDFLETGPDEYWIATESGVFIYNLKNNQSIHLESRGNDPYSLSDNAVYTLTKDREGGIWCGTYFGGLSYYPQQYSSFHKFYPKVGENSLQGYAVREIQQDNYGNLWIGTEDSGLNKYDLQTKTFLNLKPENSGLSHSNIHGLAVIDDRLWVGTFEHGLDVVDIPSSRVVKQYKAGPAPNQLKSNFIECISNTSHNGLLIGTAQGLYRYNPRQDDFIMVAEVPGNKHYTTLLEDREGTIWAGTLRDGLFYYSRRTNESGSYVANTEDTRSLSSNEINGMFIDSSHNLWVATENGLCVLKKGSKQFRRYTTKDGFPVSAFYKILEDKDKNLWVSTSKGLVVFHPAKGVVSVYGKTNGLLSDQFNYASGFQDVDGRMYFGSVRGMVSFWPSHFKESEFVPPVFITGFQIHNQEVKVGMQDSPLAKAIDFTKTVTLNHQQSSFSIDFAALGFTAPEMMHYAFMMKGMDDHWTYLQSNRKVYFTDLSPGHYTFMVRASNNHKNWEGPVTSLQIIILPPFWVSSWAYVLYTLLLLALSYLLVRNYHRRVMARQQQKMERWEVEREKELYQAKINFFTQVTHEIRTPLTLISGPLEQLIQHNDGAQALSSSLAIMKKNTDRLLALSNQLIDFRKTEQLGFNLSFVQIDVHVLVKDIVQQFEAVIRERGIDMKLRLDQDCLIAFADAEALRKMVSNLLDNAVKYAFSSVRIRITADDHSFQIVVANDGEGIPDKYREKVFEPFFRLESAKTKPGSGIGLSLARSLADLHQGRLELVSNNKQTRFVLWLPNHQEQEYILGNGEPSPEPQGDLIWNKDKITQGLPAVMVVEDHLEVRRYISDVLSGQYSVIPVEDGPTALELLQDVSVQLIISDIMMPGMDGLQLCQQLKTDLEYAHIPLILLTAKNSLQARIDGLQSGADAYIEKPFSPNHLLTQVANLIITRDKIKNYYAHSPLAHIKSMAHNKADELFLEKLNERIVHNIGNTGLDVDFLANAMHMSRPTLYRKTKAIANLSPHELITVTRLKHAATLLAEGQYKIQKIASISGFSSPGQFARSFVKQFGMTPTEYMATLKKDNT
ncbi:response regulator [Sphingobacterium sp. InxBP1]|uniref:hybrid sensor histidine kinase/response regulator transcription factor n=1 Tax=Sphingobacterium sp. InxBP1 TaxID=2870328 RepID=UPI0022434F34|nr:two-component regulator propeller domain-containing protein [Sphingobacterium sp. InxBP1]MCW8313414.1 response regulator [Sphingobacterium sp. InxBP1]